MEIIDAHCHAWPYWYEPIESALDSMVRNGVDKALLVSWPIMGAAHISAWSRSGTLIHEERG